MGPTNYGALLTQLDLSPLREGFQMRSFNRNQEAQAQLGQATKQLAREKFEYEQQKDADYLRDVEAWKAAGAPSDGLRDIALKYPEQSDRLLKAGDSYTAHMKNDMITAGFSVLGALAAGNVDLAKRTINDRITALDRARIDSTETRAIRDMLSKGDVNGARAYIGYAMSGLVEPLSPKRFICAAKDD